MFDSGKKMFDIETIRRRLRKEQREVDHDRGDDHDHSDDHDQRVTRGRASHPLGSGVEDTGERLHSSGSRGGEEEEEEEGEEEAGDVAARRA